MMEFKHTQSTTNYISKREKEIHDRNFISQTSQSMRLYMLFKVLRLKLLFSRLISLRFHSTSSHNIRTH